MTEWLVNNWLGCLIIIAAIIILALLIKLGRHDIIKKIVLSLVCAAEKQYGSGTGEIKYAYVIEKLWDKLPFIIRILYTKKEIDNMIEMAVQKLKHILSDNDVNLTGYDDELYLKQMSDASVEK